MKTLLFLSALLLVTGQAGAAERRRKAAKSEEPQLESFKSMQMEAMGIMGELKYQHGDMAGADPVFRDSLNDSRHIASPAGSVVALDLYRTAEMAARRGDYETARQRLDILTSRYADSEPAAKGRRLLDALPRKQKGDDDHFSPVTAVVTADQPEFLLGRIQAAVRARNDDAALELCRDFLRRHPTRPEAQEIRLLGAALYLRLGDGEGAERALTFLSARASDAEIRAKAIHLLGALYVSQGKNEKALSAVPAVDPLRSFSTWITRAQLWRAAADEAQGRRAEADARREKLVAAGLSSPARAYALAALAESADRAGAEARAQGRLAEAAAEARRWGMEDLESAAELGSAHALYKRRLFAKAAAAYGAFARRHPSSPQRGQALYQEGVSLRRIGRREEAVAAFGTLVKTMPQSVFATDAHLQLGQLYAEMGAMPKAVGEFETMAQTGERRGRRESQLLAAQVHYNARRFKEAIPLYQKFLAENPNDKRRAEVEDLLLNSYWLGDKDAPGFMEAAAKYPNHAIVEHVRWELGAKSYQAGDYASAAKWLAGFAADYPKSKHATDAAFYSAEARLASGDAAAAAKDYQTFLKKWPKAPQAAQAKLKLAAALDRAGDYGAAAAAYRVAAPTDPRQAADVRLARAVALEKAGKSVDALDAYEQWVKAYPRHPRANEVWLIVAQRREQNEELADAAAAYARVRDDAHRPAALFSAGLLREKLKQPQLAARHYEDLRACRPLKNQERLRGLVHLGLIYEVLDQPVKAMGAYGEVLKLAPRGGEDFKTAAQRLEGLAKDGSLLGKR